MYTDQAPATARRSDKSKGADLPQSRRPTLQSQFSQGESMNERILNCSTARRVAEILRCVCKVVT